MLKTKTNKQCLGFDKRLKLFGRQNVYDIIDPLTCGFFCRLSETQIKPLSSYRVFTKHFNSSFIAGIKKYWSVFSFPIRIVYEVLHTECVIVCKTKMVYLLEKILKIFLKKVSINSLKKLVTLYDKLHNAEKFEKP